MLLFRYLASHAFETMQKCELKVSKASSFNDPFEFMFDLKGKMTSRRAKHVIKDSARKKRLIIELKRREPYLNTKEAKRKLREKRGAMIENLVSGFDGTRPLWIAERMEHLDPYVRLVCFSAEHTDPLHEILMWSHYSSSHWGVRIGFQFPARPIGFVIIPVEYESKRVEIDFPMMGVKSEALRDAIWRSMRTKSLAWKYEEEYRLIVSPKRCRRTDALEFMPFDQGCVRRVDFGLRCPLAFREKIMELVHAKYPAIECFQAGFHESDYALSYAKVS